MLPFGGVAQNSQTDAIVPKVQQPHSGHGPQTLAQITPLAAPEHTAVQNTSLQDSAKVAFVPQPLATLDAGAAAIGSARAINESVSNQSRAENPTSDTSKGSISMLQEFVQCSKEFRTPARCAILQWRFEEQVSVSATLQFRATVAFVLDGVPHHVVGDWRKSKDLAKRDAAERALVFFVGCWGERLLHPPPESQEKTHEQPGRCQRIFAREAQILDDFCSAMLWPPAKWHTTREDNEYKAFVEVVVMDVPHQFVGAARRDESAAYADTARRVLWYLSCPGFEDAFKPDPDAPAAHVKDIPAPPANWMDVIGRVENRLQQVFAQQLIPGQSVWEWSYERPPSYVSLPRIRATVFIPPANKHLVGEWADTQRDAQISACELVSTFLETLEKSSGNSSVPCLGKSLAKPRRAADWQRQRPRARNLSG